MGSDNREPLLVNRTRRYLSTRILYYRHNIGTALLHLAVLLIVLFGLSFVITAVTGSSSHAAAASTSSPLSFFTNFFAAFVPSTLSSATPHETIFVSIASYRDTECHLTIKDMYLKSEHPERVHVGIYQQHGEKELDCLHTLDQFPYVQMQNIVIQRVHFSEGRGPVVARQRCSLLFADQDYFFQLDAHMRFIQDWDSVMVGEAHNASAQVGHSRVILSHYPLEYKVEDNSIPPDHNEITTKFCNAMYNTDGIIQPLAGIIKVPDDYTEVPFAGAGVMWGPGSMIHDCPYDPDLPFLFHGEELLYSVRLHSKGYRMFGPRHNTVFHFYNRPTFPKIWVDAPDYYTISKLSVEKVKRTLMLGGVDMDGPKATYSPPLADVEYYYEKWGFDLVNKTAPKYC